MPSELERTSAGRLVGAFDGVRQLHALHRAPLPVLLERTIDECLGGADVRRRVERLPKLLVRERDAVVRAERVLERGA